MNITRLVGSYQKCGGLPLLVENGAYPLVPFHQEIVFFLNYCWLRNCIAKFTREFLVHQRCRITMALVIYFCSLLVTFTNLKRKRPIKLRTGCTRDSLQINPPKSCSELGWQAGEE